MAPPESTSWSLVLGAAARRPADQARFAERYTPVIRAYLAARWRLPVQHEDVGDVAQEVLLQCFRQEGALDALDPARASGFRAFLYGVARNVAAMTERKWARRHETQAPHSGVFEQPRDEATLSQVFDRQWAEVVVREARAVFQRRAAQCGGRAALRARVMELRFQEGLPPRAIAPRLDLDARLVYKLLEEGPLDFQAALLEVLAGYEPSSSRAELERKCAGLLELLEA